jgi:uncharacterized membrane protein
MKVAVLAYGTTGLAFLGLDAIWLSLTASRLYRPNLGDMLLPSFNVAPAAIFYLLYVAAIIVFAVQPAISEGRVSPAILRGALLGLVAYATYDLTNQATLRNWPIVVTIADLCWGTVLTACAATVGYLATTSLVDRA